MRHGALIGPIIIAIGLVVASISFAIVGGLLKTAEGDTELRLDRTEGEAQMLRAEVARQAGEIRGLRADLARLTENLALLAARNPALPQSDAPNMGRPWAGETEPDVEEITEDMRIAPDQFNIGLTQPGNRVMLDLLGQPRETFGEDCAPVTNARLNALLETRQIGPIRVTMIRPALDSLERIMARLEESEPDIYNAIGTAGALCARLIRGSRSSISNHAWGSAIDLTLENRLDRFADGGTQFGLLLLAELFNEEGWFWGATYEREDSMHFEVSVETLLDWNAAGRL